MTNEELRDAAVTELKSTTISYPTWLDRVENGWKGKPYDPANTSWGRAFAYLDAIGDGPAPEPGGKYPVPSHTQTRTAGPGATVLNLDNAVDYRIDLDTISWSSHATADTIGLHIVGGRNVVIVGGEILFNSTNIQDDGRGILIDGGNPDGVVHLEGLFIKAPNAWTIRTRRKVVLQNVRAECDILNHDSSAGVHTDVIQVWRNLQENYPCQGIYVYRLTAYSAFTFLSDFTDLPGYPQGQQTPLIWDLEDVDLHPIDLNLRMGSGNNWMGSPHSRWVGKNCWFETSLDMAGNKRGLGDSCRQFGSQYNPQAAQYELYAAGGSKLYTSPFPGGQNPSSGKQQGDYLRYVNRAEHPHLNGMMWYYGKPPEGEFAPRS